MKTDAAFICLSLTGIHPSEISRLRDWLTAHTPGHNFRLVKLNSEKHVTACMKQNSHGYPANVIRVLHQCRRYARAKGFK